ncbi:LOB domain-containing protein 39-like [Impatiens glandulifera]|uniref:LOB domain-containing protein 39-like n=1 Tax=Impatiens glandulifera TaxID=253017 RepID=UPI001FB17931|nr:LOB domain-containing protein 39-like [Impatiens glandulifera]
MSCNGCRVLRRGCSEACLLRPCLQWIPTAQAQGNATLFVAKFFGRSDLLSKIDSVPIEQRPALFQSLLFEACGRTLNPIGGAVGLMTSRNWNLCQMAVDTVLAGGVIRPIAFPNPPIWSPSDEESGVTYQSVAQPRRCSVSKIEDVVSQAKVMSDDGRMNRSPAVKRGRSIMMSFEHRDESDVLTSYLKETTDREGFDDLPKLLNLFV